MKELYVEVITPSKQSFSGAAISVTIPGTLGGFQVLYNHAPILSSFEIGTITIVEPDDKSVKYATGGGTVEVLDNKVLILAESFEAPEEIDVERAKKALQRAKERLDKRKQADIDEARAEAALKRAVNRLKITGQF